MTIKSVRNVGASKVTLALGPVVSAAEGAEAETDGWHWCARASRQQCPASLSPGPTALGFMPQKFTFSGLKEVIKESFA